MQSAPSAADAAKAALKAEADISAAEEAAEEVRLVTKPGLTDHCATVFS